MACPSVSTRKSARASGLPITFREPCAPAGGPNPNLVLMHELTEASAPQTHAAGTPFTLGDIPPYCVQVTFVSPREAPNGKTTSTLVVQKLSASQLPSGGAAITVSATPFSSSIVRLMIAVVGMLCV